MGSQTPLTYDRANDGDSDGEGTVTDTQRFPSENPVPPNTNTEHALTSPAEGAAAKIDPLVGERQGAEAAGGLAEEPELDCPAEMIVMLEGHEPYVPQFSLNADQAMAKLGIKRSRLNQISGKELRVGRIKAGRYIKPMYRERDVEAYLEWTRPTASHQASKKALETVTDTIDAQLNVIADRICDQLHTTSHHNEQLHQSYQDRLESRLRSTLPKAMAANIADWLAPVVARQDDELAALHKELEVAQFQLNQLNADVTRQRSLSEAKYAKLEHSLLKLGQAVEMSQQSLNLAGRLEAQNSYLAGQLNAFAATIKDHVDARINATLRKISILAESQEHFNSTEFLGTLHKADQAQLDALLAHIDLRLVANPLPSCQAEADAEADADAKPRPRPKPKPNRRPRPSGASRPYSSRLRKRPSLPSHRG